LRCIEIAFEQVGAALADVVRTRIYVSDMSRWRGVGAVHGEVIGDARPSATSPLSRPMSSALIAPDLLAEIEADAYVAD